MKLEIIDNNIYVFHATNQYELAITMMRLQEFYESGIDGIKGNYFSFEQYMDAYAAEYGNFTYTTDWSGFNIPGHIVQEFFRKFCGTFSKREMELKKQLIEVIDSNREFYVIGVYQEAEYAHEIAHALYYLNKEYHNAAKTITDGIPRLVYNKIATILLEWGYDNDVMPDEIQAYLGTTPYWLLIKLFGLFNLPYLSIRKYRKLYRKFGVDF